MSFVDIESDDLLEELIERLVAVSDKKGTLGRKIVVDVVDDLRRNISLAGSWWSDDYRQTGLCAGCYRFNLGWREANGI